MKDNVIKKISVRQLKTGMYVHQLVGNWMWHPFFQPRFLVQSENDIRKIIEAGIHDLYIDTSKGLDVKEAPSQEDVADSIEHAMVEIALNHTATPALVTTAKEWGNALAIKADAKELIRNLMFDARMGKALELSGVESTVERITNSILKNPGALVALLMIKGRDEYTYLHSVSVGALMIALCRSTGMDAETVHQAGIGGMLHDIGKVFVDEKILNKPGHLTEQEFKVIQRHSQHGHDFMQNTGQISTTALDIILNHHERADGSGYPNALPSSEISQLSQMAAIVDVYDAITSDRAYHQGICAAEALRRLYEWGEHHFNRKHVHAFIRCIGIYPVGTLVMLESGRLGVVVEPHETNLLSPKVNIIFDTASNTFVTPTIVDLSKPLGDGGGDRILRQESPAKWNIDPMRFLHLH